MRFLTIVCLLLMGLGNALSAQNRPVVVELFTSQGCSSCPPADALLHDLGKSQNVIALAYHVDYWDYIGWKDEFAIPAHTERQRNYARVAGERMIYTPQIVVQGQEHAVGNRRNQVTALVAQHQRDPAQLTIQLRKSGDRATIDLGKASRAGDYFVSVVEVLPQKTVQIERGENAGRNISYSNIVRKVADLGRWNGRQSIQFKQSVTPGLRIVALVQDRKTFEIIAAARLD